MPECPIMCGMCCESWMDVPSLERRFPGRLREIDCPLLSKHGCRLLRKNRPKVCLSHLCKYAREELRSR